MQRLDRYLSEAGIASRKELRGMIRAGRVCVNGTVVRAPETQIAAETDAVLVDGQPVQGKRTIVLMLHKPAGFVTATDDRSERTVMELLPEPYRTLGLRPVGRLDKMTEGLLLFTNDGALLHRLISPRSGIWKTYYAEHVGTAGAEDIAAFSRGLVLGDGTICRPAVLKPLGAGKSQVSVQEGKYHQVRRMLAARAMPVTYLKRIAEGGLLLGDLPAGAVREVPEEQWQDMTSRQLDE